MLEEAELIPRCMTGPSLSHHGCLPHRRAVWAQVLQRRVAALMAESVQMAALRQERMLDAEKLAGEEVWDCDCSAWAGAGGRGYLKC